MSVEGQVTKLLIDAEKAAKNNELPKAAELLKAASTLQPDSDKIKKQWLALQARESTDDALAAIVAYNEAQSTETADRARKSLRQRPLNAVAAKTILDLLLDAPKDQFELDSIVAALVTRQTEVRKLLAERIQTGSTETFDQFWSTGEDSFQAFASVFVDEAIWSSSDPQKEAQQGLFRLCIARLIEAGIERSDWALRAITRLLATSTANVSPVIDEDVFDVILSSLDIRLETNVRGQATLATAKMLEATSEQGGQMFAHFVTNRVAKQTNDDLIVAFSAAAAAFPMIPNVVSSLFMTDGFVQSLVPSLEKNSDAAAAGKRKSQRLEQAALELLSAACINKQCREAIDRYCADWLKDVSEEKKGANQGLASLILAKINPSSETQITQKLSTLVLEADGEAAQAIEGLAYTSLQPKIKEEIIKNDDLIKSLIANVNDRADVAFGGLTVFTNLTTYRVKQTEEQKKMSKLKAYANQVQIAPDDPLDNDSIVTTRCKKLVDYDIVPALVACCKQNSSPTLIALVVGILLALAREQRHRAKMAQQGAVRLLLQIRDRIAKTDKATGNASLIERNTSHGLARLLISLNPSHVFSATIPAASAVAALVPLLSYDQESEQRDLLPTFESLLALTNLASMEDNAVQELILRSAWERIEDLLFSSNHMVQRGSMELVCNLMASPSCVARFADGSGEAKRRITILLALADVEDTPTRRAAGGALAMLTEWDAAVSAVLDARDGRGVSTILDMCSDESDELKHRGLVCLVNIVSAPENVGQRGVKEVKALDGAVILKDAMKTTKNQQILGLGIDVLKKIS